MSLIIKLTDADFSSSALPKAMQMIEGFPVDGLVGLYLLEDGTDGLEYSGSITDSSGHAKHGTIRSGWTNPIKRSYGLDVTDGAGLVIDTPLALPDNFTWIFAGTDPGPYGTPSTFPTMVGNGSAVGALPTNNSPNNQGPTINYQRGASDPTSSYALYDTTSAWGPSRPGIVNVTETNYNIFALRYNATTSRLRTQDRNGTVSTDATSAAAIDIFSSRTGNLSVGSWQHNLSGGAQYNLCLFALYESELSDSDLSLAIAAETKMVARGLTVD